MNEDAIHPDCSVGRNKIPLAAGRLIADIQFLTDRRALDSSGDVFLNKKTKSYDQLFQGLDANVNIQVDVRCTTSTTR